jgi:hypothetical protein
MIFCCAAGSAAVMAWSPTPPDSNSVAPTPSAAVPSPIAGTKAQATLAPPISNPLEENMKIMALIDWHGYARNGILTQGYKITVRFEDGSSRVIQEANPPTWRSGCSGNFSSATIQ